MLGMLTHIQTCYGPEKAPDHWQEQANYGPERAPENWNGETSSSISLDSDPHHEERVIDCVQDESLIPILGIILAPLNVHPGIIDYLKDRNIVPILRTVLAPLNIHLPTGPSPEEQRKVFEARVFEAEREPGNNSDNSNTSPIIFSGGGNNPSKPETNQLLLERNTQVQNIEASRTIQKATLKLKEITNVKQAFSRIKTDFDRFVHPIDLNKINSSTGKIAADAFNASLNRNLAIYENRIRGYCSRGVYLADLFNRCINALDRGTTLPGDEHYFENPNKYSSKNFLENNLLEGTGGGAEQDANYWLGGLAFEAVASHLIWGKVWGAGASAGKVVFSKVFQASKDVGLKAAIATKLTGGAMINSSSVTSPSTISSLVGAVGKGINQYVPKGAGGSASYIHHAASAFEKGALTVFEKVAEQVAQKLHQVPNLAQKAPAIAEALKNAPNGSVPLLRMLFNESGIALKTAAGMSVNLLNHAKTTNDLQKAESVAHVDAQEAISTSLEQSSTSVSANQASLALKAQDTFEDLNKVLNHLDDSADFFVNYENFVVRCQIRDLFTSLDYSSETTHHLMKRIPQSIGFSESSLEESLETANLIERTINYCGRNNVCEWVKNKLLEILRPFEKHHVFSNKNFLGGWTEKFTEILDQYGLSINGKWNFIRMPHKGKHDPEYHEWCYEMLEMADRIVQDQGSLTLEEQRELFLKIIEKKVIIPLKENPLLVVPKWYKFWQNDKLQADSLEYSSTKGETITLE